MSEDDIKIGVSSCLLGNKVRYDSGHSRNEWVIDLQKQGYVLMSVCPEVELGMPVPREKICLIGDANDPRLIGEDSVRDWTDEMLNFAAKRIRQDDLSVISGFILKDKSPSCGIDLVKRCSRLGETPSEDSTGLFADTLIRMFPDLPIIGNDQFEEQQYRDRFLQRVTRYHRLSRLP